MTEPTELGALTTAAVRGWGLLATAWLDAWNALSFAVVELAHDEIAAHGINETVVHVPWPAPGPLVASDFQPLHPGCAVLPSGALTVVVGEPAPGAATVPVRVRVTGTGVTDGGYVGSLDSGGTVLAPNVYLDVVVP